jgi:hypothetical protein
MEDPLQSHFSTMESHPLLFLAHASPFIFYKKQRVGIKNGLPSVQKRICSP